MVKDKWDRAPLAQWIRVSPLSTRNGWIGSEVTDAAYSTANWLDCVVDLSLLREKENEDKKDYRDEVEAPVVGSGLSPKSHSFFTHRLNQSDSMALKWLTFFIELLNLSNYRADTVVF